MMFFKQTWMCGVACSATMLLLLACGGEEADSGSGVVSGAGQALRLSADPGGARSVAEIRGSEATGQEVVVYGRVSSVVPGVAVFTLTDESLDYCGRGESDVEGCPTPWDYCCVDGETKASKTLVVEARDARNVVIPDRLGDLRHLDLVIAKGKLERDENGNDTIVASGWYRKERPALREGLDWPAR